jgi:2-polyprenyl-3-methyl-5-hydroxy-6-metoxy-1,4-benzoquinol methylase
MGLGAKVRRCFGPFEPYVAELYRAFFVDLGLFTRSVRRRCPEARNILEIGCGEGAICHRLSLLYPQARITGIDITSNVGRLFRGDSSRVAFAKQTIREFAAEHRGEFDLVLLCDVLHHVPWNLHEEILREGKNALRDGGVFVLKEWERRPNLMFAFTYLIERYVTGDRVRYGTAAEFRRVIDAAFGAGRIDWEQRFQPWPNNLAFFIRKR